MITPLIISLTSDFIQHVFLIVLVGIVFSEYLVVTFMTRSVSPQDFIEMKTYARAVRVALFIVTLATFWFIGEYFFETYALSYRLFLRWPLVLAILALWSAFVLKERRVRRLPRTAVLFIVLLALFIVLDIADYIVRTPSITIILAFERIATMLAFFFSFLQYFIMYRPRVLGTATHR